MEAMSAGRYAEREVIFLIHLEFDVQKGREVHAHLNYEVIFVIRGNCSVTLDDTVRMLEASEFVVINSLQRHGYNIDGEHDLIGRFHIPYNHISDENDVQEVTFVLSKETEDKAAAIDKARTILSTMFSLSVQGNEALEIQKLYYQFLELLFEYFSFGEAKQGIPIADKEEDRRICEIMEYVNHNYNKNISLGDLASRLYLSSAYLSKYIKQRMGVNFIELLNQTRLSHAANILTNTDENIAQIALDVGFSNLASFNRNFKEKYGTTPSRYRKRTRVLPEGSNFEEGGAYEEAASDSSEDPSGGCLAEPADSDSAAFLAAEPEMAGGGTESAREQGMASERPGAVQYEEIIVDGGIGVTGLSYNRSWNRTINIGTAEELLHSDVQEHILMLKNQLHFRYVRFWDIYSPGMYLDEHHPGQLYNFSRLDRVLDFLTQNHIVPHIEVGDKPKKLIRTMKEAMLPVRRGDAPFKNHAQIRYFFSALMRHLIRRYGAENLDKWVFEYWFCEDDRHTAHGWEDYDDDELQKYLDNFSVLAATVRWFGTNLKVGGGGFSLRFGKEKFERIVRFWAAAEQKPSFISLYVYPYERRGTDVCLNHRVMRDDYMKTCLQFAASVMERENLRAYLVVSEYNCTVVNRNFMNDSVYKGAWILKNLFDCMDMAFVMAYWTGSDLFAECIEQSDFISGSVGLVTRDGIKKPAWYAIEFMNSLERFILKKTEHVLVTRGKYRNYKIICHNYKTPNYRYYTKPESDISQEDMETFFDDRRLLRLYFELPVLADDTYRIKFLRINQNNGSILDEWAQMLFPSYVDSEDIDYLKKRCTPQITVRTYKEKDGKIAFTTMLEPNEIQLILVNCQGRF